MFCKDGSVCNLGRLSSYAIRHAMPSPICNIFYSIDNDDRNSFGRNAPLLQMSSNNRTLYEFNGEQNCMSTKNRNKTVAVRNLERYSDLLSSVGGLLETARRHSARTVNALLTSTYWNIGRKIIEFEQH